MLKRYGAIALAAAIGIGPLGVVLADVVGSGVSRTSGGGAGISWPVSDATFSVDDNGDGNTFMLELSGLTTDRVFIAPNFAGSQTFLVTGAASNGQAFAGALVSPADNEGGYWLAQFANTRNAMLQSVAQTPDTGLLAVGTDARSWLIVEQGDTSFDFAHALQTNPTVFIHSANQSTTQWLGLAHDATNAVISVGTGAVTIPGKLAAGGGTTVTVDGVTTFAVTSSYHILACTGAETINTITGGTLGMELTLLSNDTDCTIADDDTATAANAVNLIGTATNDVGAVGKHLFFRHDGNAWQQIAESANN